MATVLMNDYNELYAELCNVVDKALCKVSGFDLPAEIPSTSDEARECVDRILQAFAGHGYEFQQVTDDTEFF
jgi:hypothetical protein